ncbi:kinase-like protein [Punctularia strigosozonata HHB-11173 SS5]|uniref:Kinase-like protein n=1 Tax=Punctularia strigosozonata (strain HHB-11173) TaxID=741275 RepID=R7S157_PUNST|nr:kinase-like protein [Punctularia strigosozonata HHB-11173 SS5]EIN03579.1 kinase-like protein [Punctularia strigosozonata HHB-11173 SS5]
MGLGLRSPQILRTEVLIWRQLRHENILPLLGITHTRIADIRLVTPWQSKGNLSQFMKQPEAESVNRLDMLLKIGRAVDYLHNHQPNVIHGDLKCVNVLVGSDNNPLICDFGLSAARYANSSSTSSPDGGSFRWMAVELLANEQDIKPSTQSDVWSFASLAWELLTGKLPFADKLTNNAVRAAVISGERPPQGDFHAVRRGLSHKLYRQLRASWSVDPDKRPTIGALLPVISNLSSEWEQFFSISTQPRRRTVSVDVHLP